MRTDAEARELVVQITNEMFAQGLLTATGGNVSSRAADDETIWITPSRLYKGNLREEDLVRIRPDGSTVEGERNPSVEWQMHFSSYKARPDTTGALHTHAPIATAMGIVGMPFPPINTDAIFLRDTQLVPWFMPGSKELADAVEVAMAEEPRLLPAEPRAHDGRQDAARGRDARHEPRGDRQDRALREAVRRRAHPDPRRVGGAPGTARGFHLTGRSGRLGALCSTGRSRCPS